MLSESLALACRNKQLAHRKRTLQLACVASVTACCSFSMLSLMGCQNRILPAHCKLLGYHGQAGVVQGPAIGQQVHHSLP